MSGLFNTQFSSGIGDGDTVYYHGYGIFENGERGYVFSKSPTLSLPEGVVVLSDTELYDNDGDIYDWVRGGGTSQDLVTEPACFAAGTLIATPDGERSVEALQIGDIVLTQDGDSVPLHWIGKHTVQRVFTSRRCQPVCIRAGALGDAVPNQDLTVTSDHALAIDGVLVNAGALVNGASITWLSGDALPDSIEFYHLETDAHCMVIANGMPTETYVDYTGRSRFSNHREYLEHHGAERLIRENPMTRISSRRMLPMSIKKKLGLLDAAPEALLGEPMQQTA